MQMTKSRFLTLGFSVAAATCLGTASLAQQADQISAAQMAGSHMKSVVITPHSKLNGQAHARQGIPNIDSLPNFDGHFFAPGFDINGNPNSHWYFNTVGNPPHMHGTTTLDAPVIPVSIDLRDENGNPRIINGHPLFSDATQFVQPTLNSPVFSNATYTSSEVPTQFSDAIQRAEYFGKAKADWHTLLGPSAKAPRVMTLTQSAPPANPNYFFALNPDGTCCAFVLVDQSVFNNALFQIIVDAINAGDITTKSLSSFLFPDAYLFSFVGQNFECCVVGFHTYIFDPSNPKDELRWVLNYSSYVTSGIFGPDFADVTALSHEITEIYNDPFVATDGVHDVTPWWLSPNGDCGDVLETGDVIVGLPHETIPITTNGVTYHPQNEALLQWFEFQSPSGALGGAYSYPDTTILTSPSTLQKPFCQ
jgi:hypothetical protein